MTVWQQIAAFLPARWGRALLSQPDAVQRQAQDVRLRVGAPLSLSLPTEQVLPRDADGALLMCDAAVLGEVVSRLCEHSLYAHEGQLREGFIAAAGGVRAGVAGTAVCRDGRVEAVRDITALCLRVRRVHHRCAEGLLPYLLAGGIPRSLLLCSEPAAGKTALLQDAARLLCRAGRRVSVVDSRGELSAGGVLCGCDVLHLYPQAQGLLQAVRCLAPEFAVLDELGDQAQSEAVLQSGYAGVAVVASVHAASIAHLRARAHLWQAVRQGAFEYIAFLQGRAAPGQVRCIARYGEWLDALDGTCAGAAVRRCGGDGGGRAVSAAGAPAGTDDLSAAVAGAAYPHHGTAAAAPAFTAEPAGRCAALFGAGV